MGMKLLKPFYKKKDELLANDCGSSSKKKVSKKTKKAKSCKSSRKK